MFHILQVLLQSKPHLVLVADIVHGGSYRSPRLIEGHPEQLELELVNNLHRPHPYLQTIVQRKSQN